MTIEHGSVELCVATDEVLCASVGLDGTAATCTDAGACIHTPADANVPEACTVNATHIAVCRQVDLSGADKCEPMHATHCASIPNQETCDADVWCTFTTACVATDTLACNAEASNGMTTCMQAGDCVFTDLGAEACGNQTVCTHLPSIGMVVGQGGATITGGVTLVDSGLTIVEGGMTITAGGFTVTEGGMTVASGGLNVGSGGAEVTGGLTVTDAGISVHGGGVVISQGGATISGGMTLVDAGLTIEHGGARIDSGGAEVTGGMVLVDEGLTVEQGDMNLVDGRLGINVDVAEYMLDV